MKLSFQKFKFMSLTIKARLIILVGLLGVMLLAGAAIGLYSMSQQNAGTQRIYESELVPSQYLDTVRTDSLKSFITLSEAAGLVGKADQVKQKIEDPDAAVTLEGEALDIDVGITYTYSLNNSAASNDPLQLQYLHAESKSWLPPSQENQPPDANRSGHNFMFTVRGQFNAP